MIKKLPSAKMLPVGGLYPLGQYDIVTRIIPVLQIVQRHPQPRTHPWSPVARVARLTQLLVERGPVNLPPQFYQRMARIH